jgi:hypothetical protein
MSAQSVKGSVAQQHKQIKGNTRPKKTIWKYGMFTGNKYYLNHNLLVFLMIKKNMFNQLLPYSEKMQCPVLLV